MAEANSTEVTLTPEELHAARKLSKECFDAFHQLWNAALVVKAARSDPSPLDCVGDPEELADMVIAQALRTATDGAESFSELNCILTKDDSELSRELIAVVLACSHKDDSDESANDDGEKS